MHRFNLEFILNIRAVSVDVIRNSLIEFSDKLEIVELPVKEEQKPNSGVPVRQKTELARDIKVYISTEDPPIVFDTCSQFGILKSVKVEEVKA